VLYEFRHTFATRFGEAVGDPIALATILGHANLRAVMKYCHPQTTHTAKAMEKFIGGAGNAGEGESDGNQLTSNPPKQATVDLCPQYS